AADIAAARIPVVTTQVLFDVETVGFHPEQAEETHVRRVVPSLELETLRDRRQYGDYLFALLTETMPSVRGRYRNLLVWALTTDTGLRKAGVITREMRRTATLSLRYLKEAGVPLVVGSDSGNWPLFPFFFHGPTTWRE